MSAQAEREAAGELEALLQFLYLCPVGVIKLAGCGRVDMLNPMASQLLMPLARPGFVTASPRATADARNGATAMVRKDVGPEVPVCAPG